MKRFLFLDELQAIFKSKKSLVQIFAILLIPILYGGSFIWAFWDPYGTLEKLPVAVVNNDNGATLEGKKITLGNELVDNLKDKNNFKYDFVTQADAKKGLDQRKYYFVIEIPDNFSKNAATISDKSPKKLTLNYTTNQGSNYITSKIADSGLQKIKESVGAEVSKTYAKEMYGVLHKLADGIDSAGNGASKIDNGTKKLQDATKTLEENLNKLSDSSIAFSKGVIDAQDGSSELQTGAGTLTNGVQQLSKASQKLLDGSKKLEDGGLQLKQGLDKADSGLITINDQMPELISGTNALKQGLVTFKQQLPSAIAEGIVQNIDKQTQQTLQDIDNNQQQIISSIASNLSSQMVDSQQQNVIAGLKGQVSDDVLEQVQTQLASNSKQEQAAIQKSVEQQLTKLYSKQTAAIKAQVNQSLAGLKKQLKQDTTSQIAAKTNPEFDQLIAGETKINKGQQALQTGLKQLQSGTGKLSTGADTLYAGQKTYNQNFALFSTKLGDAATGANQLNTGINSLSSGLTQLGTGALQLSDGTSKLADGSTSLAKGTDNLKDGTKDLASGLKDATKQTSNINDNDRTYDMMSNPVVLSKIVENKVPNYGTGLAPYFISLGLAVGALLVTIVYEVRTAVRKPSTGFSMFISKYGVLAIIGVLQSIFAVVILETLIGIDAKNVFYFLLTAIVTSLMYMALIQCLVTLMGDPGRYIAVLLLILQLASSAGTFPVELLPKQLHFVHQILPMTYALQAFKAVISTGDWSFLWFNLMILVMFMLIFMVITVTFLTIKNKKQSIPYQSSDEEISM